MNAGFSLDDFQYFEKTGFIFPHSLINLNTVLELVGGVEISKNPNFVITILLGMKYRRFRR